MKKEEVNQPVQPPTPGEGAVIVEPVDDKALWDDFLSR